VEEKQTFIEHLEELRKRLIISLVAVGVGFGICYIFSRQIFEVLVIPLQRAMPPEATMIYTRLPEAFFTYLKVALLGGIFVASPVILYQIWLFVAPALYSREKRYAIPFVISSTILFVGGAAFGYFVVFRYGFQFFMGFATDLIRPAPTLKEYLSFCSMLLLAFGLTFELPLFILFLARLGVVDAQTLSRNRKYVILGMFAVAAIFTPPDIVTQLLMAVPLIILYEVSIVIARMVGKKKKAAETETPA
jgi:sec-independent protein translocase protein TatC